MADDTNPQINPKDFHSCDTPRGMMYYNMGDLTASQQTRLNDLKIRKTREDERYLAGHPEIRACVALITRYVFQRCPRNNLHDVIAQFFARSKTDIEKDINDYLKEREGHVYQGNSAVGLYGKPPSRDSSFQDSDHISVEQESFSGSLGTIGFDLGEIEQSSSDTTASAISGVADMLFRPKTFNTQMMEDLIASHILNKIPYDDEIIEEESFEVDRASQMSFSFVVSSTKSEKTEEGEEEDEMLQPKQYMYDE